MNEHLTENQRFILFFLAFSCPFFREGLSFKSALCFVAQYWQAMPVLIHSDRRGKNPAVIFPSALLVEGSAPKPL